MFRRSYTALLALLAAATAQAHGTEDIDPALLANSDAVVRLSRTEFVYTSPSTGIEKRIEEITILGKSAEAKAHFICYTDNTRSLKSFSGEIRDRNGKAIRKLKRSELRFTEYSATSLAQDGGCHYLEVHVPTYPFTVRYEYEIAHRNGVLVFPVFVPIGHRETSLEKGVYTLSLPEGTEFGYKCLRIDTPPEKRTEGGRDRYSWTLEHVPAVCVETASPPLTDLIPMIYAMPYAFAYESTHGSLRDWDAYAAWQYGLLEGRDRLPEELRSEVHRLTDRLDTPRAKVEALYDYLGRTTRYVSIQLGIGGLRPMAAAEVFKTKFGDCKALSNYLRAMLAECGIASDYTIIHASRPRMFRDFASPVQANHVILRVPLPNDTLYLECTNPEVPFGYIHDGIAGHDAVAIRADGAEFITLPHYADTLHRMEQRVEVTLAGDGSARGRVRERYEAGQYEDHVRFVKLDARERTEYLLSDLRKIPLVRLDSIEYREQKLALPVLEIGYTFSTPKYGNATANRAFIPLSPFSDYTAPRNRERLADIHYPEGYTDRTIVALHLPADWEIESQPEECAAETPFGNYALRITTGTGRITVELSTTIRSGTYPREDYQAYRAFLAGRARSFGAQIVLRKKGASD